MREIIFRGKRTDNGEFAYGYYADLPVGSLTAMIIANAGEVVCEDTASYIINVYTKQHSNFSNGCPLAVVESEYYEVDPATVGQYTGLLDENGRIFEGDIVRFSIVSYGPGGETIDSDKIGIIKFSEYETAIVIGDKDSDYFESDLILLGDALRADDELRVIGNIWDNKLEDFQQ